MTNTKTYHSFYRYWGKTNRKQGDELRYHLLPYHNLDVAACAQVLLEKNALVRHQLCEGLGIQEDAVVPFVTLLIAWHDIGKLAATFQKGKNGKYDELRKSLGSPKTNREYGADNLYHDTLGYLFWRDVLHKQLSDEGWFGIRDLDVDAEDDPDAVWEYFDPIAQAITGHHGTPPQYADHTARRHFKETHEDALAYARATFDLLRPNGPFFHMWNYDQVVPRAQRTSWLLAGLTVLADWIGSNAGQNPEKHYFRFEHEPVQHLRDYWSKALEQARKAVEQSGVLPVKASCNGGFQELFPELIGHEPTPMQKYALSCDVKGGPHLFTLEDLTGSGKTEASLILAHRLMQAGKSDGLYLGLPTMATANAMLGRLVKPEGENQPYRRFFKNADAASVVLAHSRSSFQKTFRDLDFIDINADPSSAENDPERGRAQCARWLADSRKRALLASVGVGTIDQALVGVLPSKHQSLRLLGLGTKVLIVDEVHAYDEYVSHLLENLLRFQAALGGSAILLSATLTQTLRQRFCAAFREGLKMPASQQGYALPKPVTLSKHYFPLATHLMQAASDHPDEQAIEALRGATGSMYIEHFEADTIAPPPKKPSAKQKEERAGKVKEARHEAEAQVIKRLVEVAEADGCACWIRNTVDDARWAYRSLKEATPESIKVRLLHSRFALDDRLGLEEEVLAHFGKESTKEERSGQILVATQVVEQSLDLDFDFIASDLAPVDLLIQRAGRLHRHDRPFRPEPAATPILGILTPAFEDEPGATWFADPFPKAKYVYPHAGWLWRTVKVLRALDNQIDLLDEVNDIRQARLLLESVYAPDDPQRADSESLDSPFVREDPEAWRIPDGLRQATNAAHNKMKRARSEAGYNELHLDGGYGGLKAGAAHWQSEKRTPTRLGEPTTTVRLASWNEEQTRLVPLCTSPADFAALQEQFDAARTGADQDDAGQAEAQALRETRRDILAAWHGSEVTVRQYHVAEEPDWDDGIFKVADGWPKDLLNLVNKERKAMPDGCRWSTLLVLKTDNDDGSARWTGFAKGEKPDGKSVDKQVIYQRTTGLNITDK